MNSWGMCVLGMCLLAAPGFCQGNAADGATLAERFLQTTKDMAWKNVANHPIAFRTYHPQGLTLAGGKFYLSSVEVIDRKADKGMGHLFEMSPAGELLRETTVAEGAAYHPGGIDFDGRRIWMPVSTYHPEGASIVYTVDPETLQPREIFRFDDHLGAVAHFADKQILVGVNWGARRFYRWRTEDAGGEWKVTDPAHPESALNGNHYIDYQDMQRVPGTPYVLCAGLQHYAIGEGKLPAMNLGGIELVNAEEFRVYHQLPAPLRPAPMPAWTQNPFYVERSECGLRFYLIPEDQKSTIHVFEIETNK